MKNATLLFFLLMLTCTLSVAQKWPGVRDSIYSDILKENRVIQVVLPKDYQPASGTKYEVLYILDGEWYMEHIPFIYNFAVSSGYAPDNIFVLLPNTYVNKVNLRDRDFSPTKKDDQPMLGGADNFHAFLKTELIPYVEKKYPANGQRSLIGSSFSGLFSVYAFIKDPHLFQSFIASDPNLQWDNNYVPKLAAEKLPGFSDVKSTLFFAGIDVSSKFMGSRTMDSVMRSKAPANLAWKFVDYTDETHYSVQHKAFYDGIRFSHLGYSKGMIAFHPMNGMLEKDTPLQLVFLNSNATTRYTTDGSEPTLSSPSATPDGFSIAGSSVVAVKTFPHRAADVQQQHGKFTVGAIVPSSKPGKAPAIRYTLYDGEWNTFPDVKKLKPTRSGIVEKDFNMNALPVEKGGAFILEGLFEVTEAGYYVFAINAKDGAKLQLAGQSILTVGPGVAGIQSYVVALKKGFYPLRFEVLKKKGSDDIAFFINRTTPSNSRWWETRFLSMGK